MDVIFDPFKVFSISARHKNLFLGKSTCVHKWKTPSRQQLEELQEFFNVECQLIDKFEQDEINFHRIWPGYCEFKNYIENTKFVYNKKYMKSFRNNFIKFCFNKFILPNKEKLQSAGFLCNTVKKNSETEKAEITRFLVSTFESENLEFQPFRPVDSPAKKFKAKPKPNKSFKLKFCESSDEDEGESENETGDHSLEDEIERFIMDKPKISPSKPQDFWKNSENYPNLKILIRRLLAIPPSSSSVERLFSSAGIVGTNLRNRTKISTIFAFLCLKFNPSRRNIILRET